MNKSLTKFVAAFGIYAVFAVYLYRPHFRNFSSLQYLLVINVCLGALGCFVLSRRWVSAFAGSLFAGAVYGFGPFLLGLGKFHPTAGFLAAMIPWLFWPAVFGPKAKLRWVRLPLAALPFLAILGFFGLSTWLGLFAIPIQTKLALSDLAGLLAPVVVAERSSTLIGFYHVPIAPLTVGLFMLFKARRFGIMGIFCLGVILAFCDSLLNVSPIIWLAVPVLCCSAVVGEGVQGLSLAGSADKKWMLITAGVMIAFCLIALLLAPKYYEIFAGLGAKHANLLVETAKMYLLGTIMVGIIFFMACAKQRAGWLRWVVLCSAMGVDIFLGARCIVDKIL